MAIALGNVQCNSEQINSDSLDEKRVNGHRNFEFCKQFWTYIFQGGHGHIGSEENVNTNNGGCDMATINENRQNGMENK